MIATIPQPPRKKGDNYDPAELDRWLTAVWKTVNAMVAEINKANTTTK